MEDLNLGLDGCVRDEALSGCECDLRMALLVRMDVAVVEVGLIEKRVDIRVADDVGVRAADLVCDGSVCKQVGNAGCCWGGALQGWRYQDDGAGTEVERVLDDLQEVVFESGPVMISGRKKPDESLVPNMMVRKSAGSAEIANVSKIVAGLKPSQSVVPWLIVHTGELVPLHATFSNS